MIRFDILLQVAMVGAPLQEIILEILKGKWDHERTKFSLPPLLNLVRMMRFGTLSTLYLRMC